MFGASTTTYLTFNSSDQLNLTLNNVSAATALGAFRDPAAWYHIVYTQNGPAQTIYVNGTSVATGTTANSVFNTAIAHQLSAANTSNYFDGYLAEVNFIDGQTLTPSSFGVINSVTGAWVPISYTGTYGTNGFYLKFADASAATAAAIGKDSSGNANNWTPSGISVTTGATYDSMIDSPTPYADGGIGRGNYAVLNVNAKFTTGGVTVVDGNLAATLDRSTYNNWVPATITIPSTGKFYFEVQQTAQTGGPGPGLNVGLMNSLTPANTESPTNFRAIYLISGEKSSEAGRVAYGTACALNDVIQVAVDMVSGKIWFGKNGTWLASGDPVAGTNAAFTDLVSSGITWYPALINNISGVTNTANINFGQRGFAYTPPTGFLALNTNSLAAPATLNPAAHMAATTYTGTGATLSPVNTVNGVSCPPDLVWVKGRSGATDNVLVDRNRGTGVQLVSNSAAVQTTLLQSITAFNTNGFTVGTRADLNTSASLYVAWQWRGGGVGANNTNGSITALVSANTAAGISIVTWTGSGAVSTIGHGLGVVPKMIIVKNRTNAAAAAWAVYHSDLTSIEYSLTLNATDAEALTTGIWNSTAPTTTVFSTGTSVRVTSGAMVAYCFAEIAGFSKFGKYIGNGSVDGPFVYCGFRPRYVMVKRTDASSTIGWFVWDTSRMSANGTSGSYQLYPNLINAESNTGTDPDILSNGFKMRGSYTDFNASGGSYIFAAFAEAPFKYALAR